VTSDPEAAKKPAGSFTTKIDELTRQNLALMTELEQWKSTALKAEALNREFTVSTLERPTSPNSRDKVEHEVPPRTQISGETGHINHTGTLGCGRISKADWYTAWQRSEAHRRESRRVRRASMTVSKGALQHLINHFLLYQYRCDFLHTPITRSIVDLLKMSSRH
jgi:hypothetical protein